MSNGKPNILIIENSIDVTGALKSITRTAYDLRDNFDFHFIIPKKSAGRFWIEGKGFNTIDELPLREISKKISGLVFYLPFLILNTFRLRTIVRENKIEVIHINDLYNLLPVMYSCLGGPVPYVCHIRFLPDRFPKFLFSFWLKLHLRYASKIIVVSDAVKKQLPHHNKITVIHNELPVEERYPDKIDFRKHSSHFTFLYLSNFIEGKGQNFALESFALVHSDLPDWKLRLVGGDMGLLKNKSYRKQLELIAKELGIFEKTEWGGFTEEVELEYKRADITLNFSESESFSITCLEALFFGCPVIATDCGGPAEIIDHEETGLLVQNRNIEVMASAMMRLATDIELRNKMSKNAKERVSKKFSVDKTSYKIKEIYDWVLTLK
jgi:glycosyltransferase involved in cell wall biosynthesis